jgi:hypothetical protein
VPERPQPHDLAIPVVDERAYLVAVVRVDGVPCEQPRQRLERRTCIADEREAAALDGVEPGDVDVHHAQPGMAERRVRRGREVRPARPDADHDIGGRRDPVGGEIP